MMQIPPSQRCAHATPRSSESKKNDLEKFRKELKGVLSRAKEANNVIDEPYFNIPLDQVSKDWKFVHMNCFYHMKNSECGALFGA